MLLLLQWQVEDFHDRGTNPQGGGGGGVGECQPIIWPNFSQNCMTMKEIGPKGGSNLDVLLHLVTRAKHGHLLVHGIICYSG